MAKSKVQFQKGYSLFDFFKDYGTEAQCENALLAWRFPNGFIRHSAPDLGINLVLRGILGKWKLTDRVLVNWLSPNT
ncbi:hypothetical protein ACK3YB_19885, partial [Aeromonas caviae]|nr:hypothetical protein [Aeromonas caviae]